jgi:hypothetical protein
MDKCVQEQGEDAVREHSNDAGARPAAQVMLDTMEPGAAVVMLSLLQWDAESGDRTASGILADCWARLCPYRRCKRSSRATSGRAAGCHSRATATRPSEMGGEPQMHLAAGAARNPFQPEVSESGPGRIKAVSAEPSCGPSGPSTSSFGVVVLCGLVIVIAAVELALQL